MPRKKKKTLSDQVYRLKVTLKGAKPPIWRRVEVAGDLTLYDLHNVIQIAMGWYDAHLHQFIVGDEFYGMAEDDLDMDIEDENKVTLDSLGLREKSKFQYQYDFGDDWMHEILVEKILPRVPDGAYPVCLKGKGACPPEDVGGVWGYADFLEIIQDPEHPEHEETLEWIGEEFKPDHFDLDAVNTRLNHLR